MLLRFTNTARCRYMDMKHAVYCYLFLRVFRFYAVCPVSSSCKAVDVVAARNKLLGIWTLEISYFRDVKTPSYILIVVPFLPFVCALHTPFNHAHATLVIYVFRGAMAGAKKKPGVGSLGRHHVVGANGRQNSDAYINSPYWDLPKCPDCNTRFSQQQCPTCFPEA
eukprot:g63558.t1